MVDIRADISSLSDVTLAELQQLLRAWRDQRALFESLSSRLAALESRQGDHHHSSSRIPFRQALADEDIPASRVLPNGCIIPGRGKARELRIDTSVNDDPYCKTPDTRCLYDVENFCPTIMRKDTLLDLHPDAGSGRLTSRPTCTCTPAHLYVRSASDVPGQSAGKCALVEVDVFEKRRLPPPNPGNTCTFNDCNRKTEIWYDGPCSIPAQTTFEAVPYSLCDPCDIRYFGKYTPKPIIFGVSAGVIPAKGSVTADCRGIGTITTKITDPAGCETNGPPQRVENPCENQIDGNTMLWAHLETDEQTGRCAYVVIGICCPTPTLIQ